jgi:hypothetical protein
MCDAKLIAFEWERQRERERIRERERERRREGQLVMYRKKSALNWTTDIREFFSLSSSSFSFLLLLSLRFDWV